MPGDLSFSPDNINELFHLLKYASGRFGILKIVRDHVVNAFLVAVLRLLPNVGVKRCALGWYVEVLRNVLKLVGVQR